MNDHGRGSCTHLVLSAVVIMMLAGAVVPPCHAASKKKESEAPSAVWPEITAAERALTKVEQDPEADAVLLINDRDGKIILEGNDRVVNHLEYHWRLKVLNDRGKRNGEIHLRSSKLSRISNIRARTVKGDGTVVTVAPEEIFEKIVYQSGSFKITESVFKFPAVEPGAILEYRYERHENLLVYISPWVFAGQEFTRRSRLTQAVPGGFGYSVLCDLCGSARPEVTDWSEGRLKGQMYAITLRDIPGYREEEMMPPARDIAPRFEMVMQSLKGANWEELKRRDNLFIDWASIARYVNYHYQKTIKDGLQELKPVVEEWAKGIDDPQEKIKAITRHVEQDFRYVDLSYLDMYPDPVASLIKSKAATNAEKVVLLMTALKLIGVDSVAALVSGKDGGSLNPKFFSPTQFTHAVVAVPQAAGTYQWIDPSVEYAPFGFVPWRDAGAEALLLKSDQGEIIALPEKNELSVTRYKVTVKPHADGKSDVETEAELIGQDAVDLRDALVGASEAERTSFLKEWLSERRPAAALQSQMFENLEAADKPLRIKMTFEAPGLVTKAEDLLIVNSCVLTCLEANPLSRRNRQYPFYVDRGWNTDETVTIVPPEGMAATQVPPGGFARSVIGTLTLRCSSQADGSARCSRQFVARRNRWPADQNAGIRSMYDKIVEADRTTVAFEKKTPGAAAGGR